MVGFEKKIINAHLMSIHNVDINNNIRKRTVFLLLFVLAVELVIHFGGLRKLAGLGYDLYIVYIVTYLLTISVLYFKDIVEIKRRQKKCKAQYPEIDLLRKDDFEGVVDQLFYRELIEQGLLAGEYDKDMTQMEHYKELFKFEYENAKEDKVKLSNSLVYLLIAILFSSPFYLIIFHSVRPEISADSVIIKYSSIVIFCILVVKPITYLIGSKTERLYKNIYKRLNRVVIKLRIGKISKND
jgi:hypothetical protein